MGVAGTGKTFYAQSLVERLRAAGKRVDVISKTHAASRRANGKTADHWVRKYVLCGGVYCDVLWIDEISQVDAGLLLQLSKLTYRKMQFVLSGDFNQFPPIGSCFRGAAVSDDAFETSRLLHTMAQGNKVLLTECRRSSTMLFDFYSSLIPGQSRYETPMAEVLRCAKTLFTYDGTRRWNLVVSHRRRQMINAHMNHEEAQQYLEHVTKVGDMLLWPGQQLFGAVSKTKRNIQNACLYTIDKIVPEESLVFLTGTERPFTFDEIKTWTKLSYAQTYASCQGSEYSGSLCLHDTKHTHFSRRHLFVGLSRAKEGTQIRIA